MTMTVKSELELECCGDRYCFSERGVQGTKNGIGNACTCTSYACAMLTSVQGRSGLSLSAALMVGTNGFVL